MTPELSTISSQFINEPGCPIQAVRSRVELEIDTFGAPIAARIFIDYRNTGDRQISVAKFRIGYIDGKGLIRGHFHAPDNHVLSPGAEAGQRWRGDKVDPRTKSGKIRALIVKFSDGTVWESEKLKEVQVPQPGAPASPGPILAAPPAEGAEAPEPAPAPAAEPSQPPALLPDSIPVPPSTPDGKPLPVDEFDR